MIALRLKSSIAIAVICFILGLFTALLLTAHCGRSSSQPSLVTTRLLKAQADSLTREYSAGMEKLESRNRELQAELEITKQELKAAKTKVNAKAAEIKKIVGPGYPARELLKKSTTSIIRSDTSLQPCDSLVTLIRDYMQEAEQKDMLYEQQIFQQDSLIEGKQAVIQLREAENLSIAALLDQSLRQQAALEKQNKKLERKNRRQRAAGRWITIGSALISGFTTHYLSNR